jgi:hypothetical protein
LIKRKGEGKSSRKVSNISNGKKCCALPIYSISSGPSAFTGFYMYPKGLMAGKDKRICLPPSFPPPKKKKK